MRQICLLLWLTWPSNMESSPKMKDLPQKPQAQGVLQGTRRALKKFGVMEFALVIFKGLIKPKLLNLKTEFFQLFSLSL